jgi:LEA14-like dessication related protein
MKKKILVIALLCLLLLLTVLLVKWYRFHESQQYPTVFEPRIEFAIIKVNSISKEEINMDAAMMIKNPLPVDLNTDSIRYKVYINQKLVMKSAYTGNVHLKGGDSSMVNFPVIIKAKELVDVLNSLEDKNIDSADYTMEGYVYLKMPVLKDKFHHFNYTVRKPAFRIPKAALTKIKVKKVGMKHTKLLTDVTIINNNVFDMDFKKMKYQVFIGGDSLATGSIDSTISLKAHSETKLTLPVDLNLKEAAEGAFDLLLKADKTQYRFTMQSTIVSDFNSLKNSKMWIETEGPLKEIKDLR